MISLLVRFLLGRDPSSVGSGINILKPLQLELNFLFFAELFCLNKLSCLLVGFSLFGLG
jgi:hypothetical protein